MDKSTITNNPNPATSADEELGLRDIWAMLVAGRRWIFGLPALSAAAALVFVFSVTPEWQSQSVIQIGQVGQVDLGQTTSLVEPPARTVERMRTGAFQAAVLQSLGVALEETDRKGRLYRDSLAVRHVPNTDLIELKVNGNSREEARAFAQATVARLQETHNKIAAPSIARLRSQLDTVTSELEHAQAERKKLIAEQQRPQEVGPGNRFSEHVLASTNLSARDAEVRDLLQRKLALEERFTPLRTYPTSTIEDVYVPEKRAWPRRGVTTLLATAGGFVLGILIALLLPVLQSPALPSSRASDATR